tara:strand:+ start:8704 stop:8868 length:165 start_codon:yes stop_codon:yes gene_type:complete
MSNFFLQINGNDWAAIDHERKYIYHRMEDGYAIESLPEEQFVERYGSPMQYLKR